MRVSPKSQSPTNRFANAEAASLPEGEDAVEADAGEGGAARAERHG